MMKTTKNTNQKGFTLIEIMIVVAVLGVLVAVAIPQYAGFAATARRAEGFSLMQGIHISETTYFTEKEEYFTYLGKLLQYGALQEDHLPRFYNLNIIISSDNLRRGYWSLLQGNIDADPQSDWLIRISGGPHASIGFPPFNTMVEATQVVIDDRIY